ncbi:MAG TPA: hemolysin family protein [Acetobacteraceae bacterium]|nr:hemolysin family protein [Acetobacteraceae bacterium]
MSGTAVSPGLWTRLLMRVGLRHAEPSLRDSIAELVQEAAEANVLSGEPPELDRHERLLIANVLRLRETAASDVMVPRADIIALGVDATLEQTIALFRTDGHSRVPVYREQLDDVVGMIHLKDVFAYVGRPEAFSIEAIMRKPLLIAPQIPVLDLLAQMRLQRMHLALVVDEYGGIDGLVTIEDLVETITGDISDEHDDADAPMLTERPDGSLDVNARLPVEEFEEKLGPVLSEDERDSDIHTVGGLVFTLAGRVPAKGEVVSHPSGLEFRVLDADPRHIRRVRVRRPSESGEVAKEQAAAE